MQFTPPRVPKLSLLLFASLILACGGDDDDDDGNGNLDASISPSCQEATTHSDLAWIQDNIFTPNCAAFGSCHMGAAAVADGLNLETGMTETETVGIDSVEDPRYQLIVAGNADDSYLLMVMNRNPANNEVIINRAMPLGDPSFCDEKKEAIARWINSL